MHWTEKGLIILKPMSLDGEAFSQVGPLPGEPWLLVLATGSSLKIGDKLQLRRGLYLPYKVVKDGG